MRSEGELASASPAWWMGRIGWPGHFAHSTVRKAMPLAGALRWSASQSWRLAREHCHGPVLNQPDADPVRYSFLHDVHACRAMDYPIGQRFRLYSRGSETPTVRCVPRQGSAMRSPGSEEAGRGAWRQDDRTSTASSYPISRRLTCGPPQLSTGRNVGARAMFHVKQRARRCELMRFCVSYCASPRFSFLKALSAGKLVGVGRERCCHGGIWLSQRRETPLGRSDAANPVVHRVRSDKGCCRHDVDPSRARVLKFSG